jgi:transposase-like protein
MARPSKRTPDRRATLLRALRSGATYNRAARAADMSPSLFRQWRSDDPTLAAEVADALAAAAVEGDLAGRRPVVGTTLPGRMGTTQTAR